MADEGHERDDDERPDHKLIDIVVNTRPKQVAVKELSFEDVIRLAYDDPPSGENVMFTVTYRRGHGDKPEGSLTAGHSVRVHEGMVFNVKFTDKS